MNIPNIKPNRREWISAAAVAAIGALMLDATASRAQAQSAATNGVTRSAEAIHQTISFPTAPPKRLYDALTIAAQFQKVESLSDAAKSMNLATNPVTISTEPGGAFSIFGGYITGRQIELVPSERIVQAWRVGNWAPGQYSLARFQLAANGVGTTLTFDHTGFPVGDGEHLSEGWVLNYWQPLTKFLG
jgi:activator of HSP90 ATPase